MNAHASLNLPAVIMNEDFVGCPLCAFKDQEVDVVRVHMEHLHPETQSTSNNRGEASSSKDAEGSYAECPVCEETLMLDLMDYHMQLHDQENELDQTASSPPETTPPRSQNNRHKDHRKISREAKIEPPSLKHRRSASPPRESSASRWKKRLTPIRLSHEAPTPGKRLGRSQLGKYHDEERMPDWLEKMLRKEGQVEQGGVIPVLEQLLEQSSGTKYAYLCHAGVRHVSRLKKEGGFCGYRNIQMMASYAIAARHPGHTHFKKKIPSIFRIQDWVEKAWDEGINSHCRAETGGIRMTRKFIGTAEAAACFQYLGIPNETTAFKNPSEPGKSQSLLLQEVESYFASGTLDPTKRIRCTNLPPIYFQHRGHSMTIVGFEKQKDGRKRLLVFDPSFKDPWTVRTLIGKDISGRTLVQLHLAVTLNAYRRGGRYLRKYEGFEILRLQPPDTHTAL